MRSFRIPVVAALLLVGLAMFLAPGAAAERVTWGISPSGPDGPDTRSVIEHIVDPGTTLVEHVVVNNYSEEPITVDLYPADAVSAQGQFEVAAPDEDSEAVGAWLELSETTVEIPARDHVVVEVFIDVPANAEPGDHAGGVLASRSTVSDGREVAVETERRVGTRVYLRVAGQIRPSLEISALAASYSHSANPLGRGELEVALRIHNAGNIRLSGNTRIEIAGSFGLVDRSIAGPQVEDLLPGHWVDDLITVDGLWPAGPMDVSAEVTPTESAGQSLDGNVDPGTASQRVWAVPYAALALLAALLAVVLVLLWRRRRGRVTDQNPVVEGS